MKEAAYFKSHGGHLATGSAKPLRSGKGSVFEGGFREPCIVRGPGIPAGKISDGMISTLDVLPTFTALAGAKLPAGRKLDGYDQSAFLTGKSEKSARDRFFYHIRNELQAVRHNEWKLILPKSKLRYGYARDPQFPEAELYNLAKDIGESKNVAAEHPEIVARLSAMAKEVPSLGKK
jgi:arylsulfatase A-like enzyme